MAEPAYRFGILPDLPPSLKKPAKWLPGVSTAEHYVHKLLLDQGLQIYLERWRREAKDSADFAYAAL